MVRLRRSHAWLVFLGLNACVWMAQAPAKPQTSPPPPPAPSLSGNIPLDLKIPDGVTTPEQARPYFDTFSWQSFIALNWPAAPSPRGTPYKPDDPSIFTSNGAGGQPVVWGTYKEEFELFDQGRNRPTAWDSSDIPVNPCGGTKLVPGQKVFVRYSKGDSVVEIDNQAFSYPLIDQNLNYAVYEVRLNESQYNFIRGVDTDQSTWLYFVKNLAGKEPIQMPASTSGPPKFQGAIMVKAAWRVLGPKDNVTRYYSVSSLVLDPETGKCTTQQVGLVGFHIAQKLKSFPQWIWSTFEQEDNVPGQTSGPYSFNNGTNNPQTVGGYANRPPAMAPQLQPVSQRKPVQVTRFNPIPDSTAAINVSWQKLLNGTVWNHYQLVMTQWPSNPTVFKTRNDGGIYPQDAGGAFPVNGVTNTVMETYFQSASDAAGAGGNSCMSCHYGADQADFSWTLLRGAH
jgi:hypothetical protein